MITSSRIALTVIFAAAAGCASDQAADKTETAATPTATAAATPVGVFSDEIPLGQYTIRIYSSTPDDAAVNAYVVYGPKEAVLIDTALVVSEAEALAEHLASLPVPLARVWITHGHPDHFMGLDAIVRRFPDAQVLARPHTIENMKTSFARYQALLEKFFPGNVAKGIVEPVPYTDTTLPVGDERLGIIDFANGESEFTTVVTFPTHHLAFVADMAYHDVHPWLNELRPDGVLAHIAALRLLPDVETLYPGHGAPMTKNELAGYERYVNDFLAEVETSTAPDELVAKMAARYPDYQAMAGLRFSAQAFMAEKAKRASP